MAAQKIMIDSRGVLFVQRGSAMKAQRCPYKFHDCTDACPMFQEPDFPEDAHHYLTLTICDAVLCCEEFEDRRA